MIRYSVTPAELEAAIEKEQTGWLAKAREKTEVFRAAGDFNEPDGRNSWSEIKDVYIRLQRHKCAFCDRLLSSPQYGRIEHDVEHFRPKNAIRAWPVEKVKGQRRRSYRFTVGEATEKGYYLLAYNIFNYATSCKTCNSTLKRNYFPIAGKRIMDSDDFDRLRKEKPYLIYPIGSLDDDPEALITYRGVLPVPRYKNGHRHRRARVTIDLFALDIREELLRLRAEVIQKVWLAFLTLHNHSVADGQTGLARRIIEVARSHQTSQSACARAFYDHCQRDAASAHRFAEEAEEYIQTNSVTPEAGL
jgi:hypothetical protein